MNQPVKFDKRIMNAIRRICIAATVGISRPDGSHQEPMNFMSSTNSCPLQRRSRMRMRLRHAQIRCASGRISMARAASLARRRFILTRRLRMPTIFRSSLEACCGLPKLSPDGKPTTGYGP
jgi:hypothetical protein